MKKLYIFVLMLCISGVSIAGKCDFFYAGGIAPVFANAQTADKTKELCSSQFVVMHSGITHGPLWSAEHLTRQQLLGVPSRINSFHADTRLVQGERSELFDFVHSGYDRGHMTPSGDQGTPEAQHESFALSNMIPQNANNNRQLHAHIEATVRSLALENGELFVITGPLFIGDQLLQLNNRLLVPTHIFKLIYDPKSNKAAVYLEQNSPGNDYKIISVGELNRLAGINFLFDGESVGFLNLPRTSKRKTYYND